MTNTDYIIREIEPRDNDQVKTIVQHVILEMGAPKVGTAYEDEALEDMHTTYQKDKSIYFVVESNGVVLGGGGISQLDGFDEDTCELQKMYFSSAARGLGLGKEMIDTCLDFAKANDFTMCYLETLPYMEAAQKLYLKTGFDYIDGPMGDTGHTSCNVWLTKSLV